jgi:hypothetical protein
MDRHDLTHDATRRWVIRAALLFGLLLGVALAWLRVHS